MSNLMLGLRALFKIQKTPKIYILSVYAYSVTISTIVEIVALPFVENPNNPNKILTRA